MSRISVVATNTDSSNSGGTSTLVVTLPVGTLVGDFMVLLAHTPDAAIPAPPGFTTIATSGYGTSGDSTWWGVFYRFATQSDITTGNFTYDIGRNTFAYSITSIRGVNPNLPFTGSSTFSNGLGGVSTASDGSISPTTEPYLIIYTSGSTRDGLSSRTTSSYQIVNNNPTWTEFADLSCQPGGSGQQRFRNIGIAGAGWSYTGSTGAASVTYNSSVTNCAVGIFALQPEPVKPSAVVMSVSIPQPAFVVRFIVNAAFLISSVSTPISGPLIRAWKNVQKTVSNWTNLPKS